MTIHKAPRPYSVHITIEDEDNKNEEQWHLCVTASNSIEAVDEARRVMIQTVRGAGKCYECS